MEFGIMNVHGKDTADQNPPVWVHMHSAIAVQGKAYRCDVEARHNEACGHKKEHIFETAALERGPLPLPGPFAPGWCSDGQGSPLALGSCQALQPLQPL